MNTFFQIRIIPQVLNLTHKGVLMCPLTYAWAIRNQFDKIGNIAFDPNRVYVFSVFWSVMGGSRRLLYEYFQDTQFKHSQLDKSDPYKNPEYIINPDHLAPSYDLYFSLRPRSIVTHKGLYKAKLPTRVTLQELRRISLRLETRTIFPAFIPAFIPVCVKDGVIAISTYEQRTYFIPYDKALRIHEIYLPLRAEKSLGLENISIVEFNKENP